MELLNLNCDNRKFRRSTTCSSRNNSLDSWNALDLLCFWDVKCMYNFYRKCIRYGKSKSREIAGIRDIYNCNFDNCSVNSCFYNISKANNFTLHRWLRSNWIIIKSIYSNAHWINLWYRKLDCIWYFKRTWKSILDSNNLANFLLLHSSADLDCVYILYRIWLPNILDSFNNCTLCTSNYQLYICF